MKTLLSFTVAALLLSAGSQAMAADAAKGAMIFKRCATCHTLEKDGANKQGPNLHGIFGRKAGTLPNYVGKYSDAMKSSGIVWTDETVGQYLENPKGFIPKNKMIFVGLKKPDDRANVIAYLKEATK